MEPLQNQKIRRRSESAVHRPVEARAAALPTREEVIAYIGGAPAPNGERAPGRVTKRDIARAFSVKGEAKAELKLLNPSNGPARTQRHAFWCGVLA
jgi:hypothetical protein